MRSTSRSPKTCTYLVGASKNTLENDSKYSQAAQNNNNQTKTFIPRVRMSVNGWCDMETGMNGDGFLQNHVETRWVKKLPFHFRPALDRLRGNTFLRVKSRLHAKADACRSDRSFSPTILPVCSAWATRITHSLWQQAAGLTADKNYKSYNPLKKKITIM